MYRDNEVNEAINSLSSSSRTVILPLLAQIEELTLMLEVIVSKLNEKQLITREELTEEWDKLSTREKQVEETLNRIYDKFKA